MNLETAQLNLTTHLGDKQDPDIVEYHKQWDEFGVLKGWMIKCTWIDEWGDRTHVDFDMTNHYTRAIGNLEAIPDYQPGVHQSV